MQLKKLLEKTKNHSIRTFIYRPRYHHNNVTLLFYSLPCINSNMVTARSIVLCLDYTMIAC